MIIGITAGIVYGSFDLHFPQVFETTIGLVATAESPVALFVIGGSLVGLKLTGQRTDIAAVVIGKLILHPLTVLAVLAALALVAPPMDAKLTQAAVLFAAMPMLSIYPVLAQKYDLAPFCAAALLAKRSRLFSPSARCFGRCRCCRGYSDRGDILVEKWQQLQAESTNPYGQTARLCVKSIYVRLRRHALAEWQSIEKVVADIVGATCRDRRRKPQGRDKSLLQCHSRRFRCPGLNLERVVPVVRRPAFFAPCSDEARTDVSGGEERTPALALPHVGVLVQAAAVHADAVAGDDDVADGGGGKTAAAGHGAEPRPVQKPGERGARHFEHATAHVPACAPQRQRQEW